MESDRDLNTMPQEPESSLAEKVARLEKRLDDVLLLLTDTYRYGKLRELLEAGKFREADLETTRVMVEITGKPDQEAITPEDMKRFPCNALMVIDQLWQKYSNDRFGFSVQLSIYQDLGGTMDTIRSQDNKYLRSTSEKVGWRVDNKLIEYDDFDFSLNAAVGAFPGNWWNSPYGAKMANFFLARLIACEI
ncbi:GUN4-like protein [Xenococcus sp. PCC 7305]|uniref:GUN4 domain-containing protein n=1 Tax=Xenococcus sp. PCC 7305 TaxID=102125 RepID=UPI0002AC63AC|nr:GUN4 domain-containing protein [Xenococcus sp. PCC 7305]ELS04007.1 GUN4-like protein [Xenococcus sp. PCC 7305]